MGMNMVKPVFTQKGWKIHFLEVPKTQHDKILTNA